MRLNDEEKAMLDGARGEALRVAMEHQQRVGEFFDAEDLVPIGHVHIMADTEALGEAGVQFLERLAAMPADQRKLSVPTVTDPRGADFNAYERIKHDPAFVDLERRADKAFRAMGVLMTDTCINYQIVVPPVFGEHVAFGDTGSSIYTNSVLGARTNFEGGPSAMAAALTGRTPRYGFHLDSVRRGTCLYKVTDRPRDWADWGALGGVIGRDMRSYFDVPVIDGIEGAPTSDELKHFGAALASFGSTPLFHMVGVTPEAHSLSDVFDGKPPAAKTVGRKEIDALYADYAPADGQLDVVVFAAPQLSLMELQRLAGMLDGKRVHKDVTMLVCTAPDVKSAALRMGVAQPIEASGAVLLEGVCFYNMHARELGQANGWTRLMTNSAKLTNIIGGYFYEPTLAPMQRCVDSAVAGRMLP